MLYTERRTMKIINLIEDTSRDNGCLSEHGLSFYIETQNHKILADTGATDAFIKNAEKLGVDLKAVDIVILSHGHYDHTGGVMSFAKINPDAKIYMQESALDDYYNLNSEVPRYIGVDKNIAQLPQFCPVKGNLKIDDELQLFTDIKGSNLIPSGNKTLMRKNEEEFVQDDFCHEQCLVISDGNKKYLLSGCAHNGILNILETYTELFRSSPDFVISGFHLMNKKGYSENDIILIKNIAEMLNKTDTVYFTCHCTTEYPYQVMKKIMKDKLHWISSGDNISDLLK